MSPSMAPLAEVLLLPQKPPISAVAEKTTRPRKILGCHAKKKRKKRKQKNQLENFDSAVVPGFLFVVFFFKLLLMVKERKEQI